MYMYIYFHNYVRIYIFFWEESFIVRYFLQKFMNKSRKHWKDQKEGRKKLSNKLFAKFDLFLFLNVSKKIQ